MAVPVKDVEPLTDLHSKIVEILDYLATVGLGNTDATLLEGEPGSFYRDATNLNAGTLPDARLSANVARLNTFQIFGAEKDFTNAANWLNTIYGGRAGRVMVDATGNFILRPTTAPGAFPFDQDFLWDFPNQRWSFDQVPYVGNNPIAVAGPFLGQVINAAEYGLRESATAAVNTAALNAASAALRDAISGVGVTSEQYIGATLRIPPGVYNIAAGAGNVGWDLSLIRSGLVRFECDGAVFLADATLSGKTVIDCIGSRFFNGVLPEVRAFEKASPPAIGLQFGRHENGTSCGEHHFRNLHIRGYFTRTAVYNSNAEECVFDHPVIFNYQATSTSYAWIQDGFNVWLPITDVSVTGLTQNLAKPFNLNTFINGAFRKYGYDIDTNTVGPATGSPVYMVACKSHRFINSYFVTTDDSGIVMAGEASGFHNIRFDQCHWESTLDHAIKMIVVSGTAWIGKGIQVEIVNSHAVVSLFEIDAGITTVNIHDFDLSVRNWNTAPSSNIFDAPAKVTLTGARVSLPNLTHWVAVASFQGDLITPGAWEHGGNVTFTGAYARVSHTTPTVLLEETDASNKQWGVRGSGSVFQVLEDNTNVRLQIGLAAKVLLLSSSDLTWDGNAIHHKGDGLQQQTIVLADDTAAAVTLPANCTAHFLLAITSANGNTAAAELWANPAANTSMILSQVVGGIFAILDGTALTGTTGADAKVTFGVTAGVVYLENRAGASRTFSLSFLANR